MRNFLDKVRQNFRLPIYGVPFLIFYFLIAPASFAFIIGDSMLEGAALFLIVTLSLLLCTEILFMYLYKYSTGARYKRMPKLDLSKLYVKPHPYMPYVMKKNFVSEKKSLATYPLHRGRFNFGQFKTNSLGFVNGLEGDREVKMPKPKNLMRINCIGASTTGNYIEEDGLVYSYPLELELLLKGKMSNPVEVNNFGQGGYNSADILVRFALQIIDTNPDVVVIYHAYNDIRAYLTANFQSDYSHSRINLGESYWKFALAAKIPDLPISFLNYMIALWLPISSRNSLLEQVSVGDFGENNNYTLGLIAYKRNMQHIIDICISNKIKVVLSTYCHFLYDEIKQDSLHLRYKKIVDEENKIVRDLALKNQLILVDNAEKIPKDMRYFVDSIHFTPEGMRLVAENISEAILTNNIY